MNNNVEIKSSKDAKELILSGAIKLEEAVSSTLGPLGRNVIIEHLNYSIPQVTKDGVTVAKKINLINKYENMGCQLVKQASIKTAIDAGDGTTSSVILATSLMKVINEKIKEGNINVHQLRKEIEIGSKKIIEKLKEISVKVENNEQIFHVATISANNDQSIGSIISDAYKKIGNDGVITVEPSNTTKTTIDIVDGIEFDKGWSSHYFINKSDKMSFEAEDCGIFITDYKIERGEIMMKILRHAVQNNHQNLLIIAENIEGEALQTLIANHQQKKINVCLVTPPQYGVRRREYLTDLSCLVMCEPLFADNPEIKLENLSCSNFGFAKKVIIGRESTIINGYGDEKGSDWDESIRLRIDQIRSVITDEKDQSYKDWYEKRIANLSSAIAIIRLGGNSETEIYETKDRLDDALAAVKSSLDEGIVTGCGSTYIKLRNVLDDEIEGEKILKQCLSSIFFKICENGYFSKEKTEEILRFIKHGKNPKIEECSKDNNRCYNAKTDEFIEDGIVSGIIDPTKVVRNCIENAVSVASMFTIVDYAIITVEDPLL